MFNKRQPGGTTITVIAAGSLIEGTLRLEGTIQVDGRIDGTLISEGQVSVGPQGQVRGEIEADSLSVGGTVEGNVTVRGHLHVLSAGRLQGEARYATLEVERGGVMHGRTSMLEGEAPEAEGEGDQALQAIDAAE